MLALVPETAPFTDEQRAWLNGFVAGLLGAERALAGAATVPAATPAGPAAAETMPWHDPTLALEARIDLAAGRPLDLKLMAAMGQLDCGQCGYECRSYAAAIACGSDTDLGKCVLGGRATARKLKELVAHAGGVRPAAAAATRRCPRGSCRAYRSPARARKRKPTTWCSTSPARGCAMRRATRSVSGRRTTRTRSSC